MKTQDYTIAYLKEFYPNLQYADDTLYLGEEIIEENADWRIAEHYDGYEILRSDPSGNPELEYTEMVYGEEYIAYQFGGDYAKAFNLI